MNVVWTTGDQISQVMQCPLIGAAAPPTAFATLGTAPLLKDATLSNDLRFRKIFHCCDALRGVRYVFTRSRHCFALHGMPENAGNLANLVKNVMSK
jgi:hypothetical protein